MFKTVATRFARPTILTALLFAAAWIAAREPAPAVHASPVAQAAAQSQVVGEGPNRAAIAVKFGDGRVETQCVAFSEDQIGGGDLLDRSGLDPAISPDGAVCSISGEGCTTDDCFCSCENSTDCQYWAFYQWQGSDWVYSQFGVMANSVIVSNGTLHGWAWGAGDYSTGAPPPDVTYDQICSVSTSTAGETTTTPTATATTTASSTLTPGQSGTTPSPASPTATPLAIVTQGPRPFVTVAGQGQPRFSPTPGSAASPLAPQSIEGGVPLAPTTEPLPLLTPSPQATATSYQFRLPPTETPRPRRILAAESAPTPTPLLLARIASGAGQGPAAKVANSQPAVASGSEQLVQRAPASARSFSPDLLPGYAAYIATVAVLLVMAWYALHRWNARSSVIVGEPDEEGRPRHIAGRE